MKSEPGCSFKSTAGMMIDDDGGDGDESYDSDGNGANLCLGSFHGRLF